MKSPNIHPETYRFAMEQALSAATQSDDPSTQVGAILVSPDGTDIIAHGCNNMPEKVRVTPERMQRPLKYDVREHAERDAIFRAAKLGRQMLHESGVAIVDYDFPDITIPPLHRNGELWTP